MAKLYFLRYGTGDKRVASSFDVSSEMVRRLYGNRRVSWTEKMPTINTGSANPVSDPQVVVIELLQDELGFGSFRSPGFNILIDVDAVDAYKQLAGKIGK